MSSAASGRSAAGVPGPAVVTGAAGAAATGFCSGESGCCAAATPACNTAIAASQRPFRQPITAFAIISRGSGAIVLLPHGYAFRDACWWLARTSDRLWDARRSVMDSGTPGIRDSGTPGSRFRRGAPLSMATVTRALARCQQILHRSRMTATFIARGRRARGRERDTSAAKPAVHGRDQANHLLERWQAARDKLPDGRRRLLDGILEYLDETVFLTSPELAARFDTDAATVVRTVQALGYIGFADFARDLRSYFLSKVNPYRVMEAEAEDHKGAAHHVRASVQRDLQNVQLVNDRLDPAALVELGERIARCRHVIA